MIKCKWCKKKTKNKKFCNQECWHNYFSKNYSGKNSPYFGKRSRGKYIKCSNCNKEIWVTFFRLKQLKNHFCSRECWKEFQIKTIKVKCFNCEKMCEIIPYDKKIKKSFFCNKICKYEWQKKNSIGKKNYNFGNMWSKEQKESLAKKQKTRLRENPDKHPNRILAKNGGISTPQKQLFNLIKKYFPSAELNHTIPTKDSQRHADIGIPEFKLDIEYDGDYWHQNKEEDRQRDQELLEVCWKTIRFTYKDLKNSETIIKKIQNLDNSSLNIKSLRS